MKNKKKMCKISKQTEELPFEISDSTAEMPSEVFELIEDGTPVNDPEIVEYIDPSVVRILTLDIETSPVPAYVWNIGKQYVGPTQLAGDYMILGFAAKWLNDPLIVSTFMTPAEISSKNEKRVIESVWKLMDEANIIVGHNVRQFDLAALNSKFLEYGLPPVSPYQIVDTYAATKGLKFTSNSLNFLSKKLIGASKIKTDFELWTRCLSGDSKAIFEMEAYCKNDISLSEQLYIYMRPFIKSHPNMGMLMGAEYPCCPNCGSHDIELLDNAYYATQQNKYDVIRCKCGCIARTRKSSVTKSQRAVMLVPTAR